MIGAYLRERFPLKVFIPLAAVIAAASGEGAAVGQFAAALTVALLLLAEFRLWDDLADRRHDARVHPERVLVRAASLQAIVLLCLTLAAVNAALVVLRDGMGIALAALVSIHAVLALLYAGRSRRTIAGDQLLLSKYPACVAIVGGANVAAAPVRITLCAAAIYLAASAYEAWHDPASPVAALLSGGRS